MKSSTLTVAEKARRRQSGQLGILGVVIGIALVALAIIGAMRYFGGGSTQQTATSEAANIALYVAGTQKLYHGSGTGYAGITPAALIGNGVVPKSQTDGTNINSMFTTVMSVAPASVNGGTNNAAVFTENVPSDMCSNFVKAVSGNVLIVTASGVTIVDKTAGVNTVDPTQLATGCKNGSGAPVSVAMTFGMG